METVRWFKDIGLDDVGQVGGKGANLGELTRAGLPVPRGFVVTSGAFLEAIARSGVRDKLRALVEEVALDDSAGLARAAEAAQGLVRSTQVPQEIGESAHIESSVTDVAWPCAPPRRPRTPATRPSPG